IITPNAVYCGAKHGMVAWGRALRYEVERFGVRVSTVSPGFTRTAFHDHPTFARRLRSRSNLRQGLSARRVAEGIVRASHTGQRMVYVPWWHRALVWGMGTLPIPLGMAWDRLAARRIESLYDAIDADS